MSKVYGVAKILVTFSTYKQKCFCKNCEIESWFNLGDEVILINYDFHGSYVRHILIHSKCIKQHRRVLGNKVKKNYKCAITGKPLTSGDVYYKFGEALICEEEINKALNTPIDQKTLNKVAKDKLRLQKIEESLDEYKRSEEWCIRRDLTIDQYRIFLELNQIPITNGIINDVCVFEECCFYKGFNFEKLQKISRGSHFKTTAHEIKWKIIEHLYKQTLSFEERIGLEDGFIYKCSSEQIIKNLIDWYCTLILGEKASVKTDALLFLVSPNARARELGKLIQEKFKGEKNEL